jgi:hypothetical protein
MRRGLKAFLMGTATDLPTRGFGLRVQRRDDVEAEAGLTGLIGMPPTTGIVRSYHGHRTEGN